MISPFRGEAWRLFGFYGTGYCILRERSYLSKHFAPYHLPPLDPVPSATILLIEDEAALAEAIADYLRQDDYDIIVACDFNIARVQIATNSFDCALIDVTLPGGSGLDLVRGLRQNNPHTGILVISARDSVEDKVCGLDLGADDYLAKPFHLSELASRVRALVRRLPGDAPAPPTHFGAIAVDREAGWVQVAGVALDLTPSEYALLLFFLANVGRVVTKEALASAIIGEGAADLVSYDFLYSHIKNLRRKLIQAGAADYLQSVYGRGYKWTAA